MAGAWKSAPAAPRSFKKSHERASARNRRPRGVGLLLVGMGLAGDAGGRRPSAFCEPLRPSHLMGATDLDCLNELLDRRDGKAEAARARTIVARLSGVVQFQRRQLNLAEKLVA